MVEAKIKSGEFETAEAVLEAALTGQNGRHRRPRLSPSEGVAALEALFAEVDRDPSPRKTPLPPEAFDRA